MAFHRLKVSTPASPKPHPTNTLLEKVVFFSSFFQFLFILTFLGRRVEASRNPVFRTTAAYLIKVKSTKPGECEL